MRGEGAEAIGYSGGEDTQRDGTARHGTAQHSTAQHSTAQHSTGTARHSTNQLSALYKPHPCKLEFTNHARRRRRSQQYHRLRKHIDAEWTKRMKGCLSKQAVYCVTCIDCLASSLQQQQLIKRFKYVDGGLVNGAHDCAACIDNVAHCAHHNGCCSCIQPCTTRKQVWDAASTVWGLSDCAQQQVSRGDALRSTQSPLL